MLIRFIEDLPIEEESFQIIYNLLKFYRTPLFIACKPFYKRVLEQHKDFSEFQEIGSKIGKFVKSYVGDKNMAEL